MDSPRDRADPPNGNGADPGLTGPPREPDGTYAVVPVPTAAELEAMGRTEYDEIHDDAFWLLRRRLRQARGPKGGGKAGKIEDTHLFRLGIELLKTDTARAKQLEKPPERTPQVVNITTLVDGLPRERATELLVRAIRELENAGRDATAQREALATVVGGEETERLLAIEAKP